MNKLIVFSALLLTANLCLAQETVKNHENSEYRFTKIAHLDASPVQSQGYTGTCWSFSALSFFESELIRKGNPNPPILSEMYVVRKAYESKAEKYVRLDGKGNFSEGGAFHDIPYVIRRYGIVPADVYKGLNYGSERHNHGQMYAAMNGLVEGVVKEMGNLRGGELAPNWKKGLAGILDSYLGEDPTEFEYDGKKYTPRTYANSLGLDMNDYVSLTSFTNHTDYEQCYLAIPDNWAWGTSYNVPLNDLLEVTKWALEHGYTIAWGADVSEKGFSFRNGIAIAPEDLSTISVSGRDNRNFSDAGADKKSNAFMSPVKELNVTRELRQEGYDNKTTTDDHGMHITGLYKDQNGTHYFLVKNSWGTGNYPEGYLYVSENYFKWKTINIYLHKDGIPKDLRKKLKL
ncbi:MAG: aminopeptidase [Bacteroidetes bacterium]|nr:MAG: aminopeptidase [Bacteroidota bacterium]